MSRGRQPELSPSVERALSLPRPRWRGVIHRWAFFVSLPVGVACLVLAPDARSTLATGFFSAGMWVMFGTSAVVHYKQWSAEQFHLLFRLDHSAIFFDIAAQATGVVLLTLDGKPLAFALAWFWLGAAMGIGAEWVPFHPPRGLMNALFLSLGWGAVLLVPWLWNALGGGQFALLAAGGLMYTFGAIVVGARRPDPDPDVFGYHEIWHALVVLGVTCHLALLVALYP
ncbi:MAG: hemolysin III family protein [Acidimicrobiia bacterium]|nr:hemolysin III family protein [Acidimicrobiia bacterium]MDH5236722.1 hemolysin III family protein [Acidimicrobiia bacterium]